MKESITEQEKNTTTLVNDLNTLIHSPVAQREYQLLGCGHSIPTSHQGSAPAWQCPQCQTTVTQQRAFQRLAFVQATQNALHNTHPSQRLNRLQHIEQYFYKVDPKHAVRASDGRLHKAQQAVHYPGAFIPLSHDECTLILQSHTLIAQLIHALHSDAQAVVGVPVQPIRDQDIAASLSYERPERIPVPIRRSIYREIKRFNRPSANASNIQASVKTHRAMIRSLRIISESTATLYAQSAHESIRDKQTSIAQTDTHMCINECQHHPAVNNHCAISLDDFPEAPVYADCGHSFNRMDILDWLEEHDDCPCCRKSINTLTAIPVRSHINAALREQNPAVALSALHASIAPFHVNWPYVVTTAVRNDGDLNAELVWQKTPESTMDLSHIVPQVNACIETLSHRLRWTPNTLSSASEGRVKGATHHPSTSTKPLKTTECHRQAPLGY